MKDKKKEKKPKKNDRFIYSSDEGLKLVSKGKEDKK